MKIKYSSLLFITILIVALLVSATLNLWLFKQAKDLYLQQSFIRLDPLGISSYSNNITIFNAATTDMKRIVFFGDSRSKEWIFPDNQDQFLYINRGIGGQTTSQVAARFDSHIKPLQPHVIVVQVGINDLKLIPLLPSDKNMIIAHCKQNISEIVSKSLDLGSAVILTTIFPLGKIPIDRRLLWSDDVTEAMHDVNNYIHSLKGLNVSVIDTAAILANEKGIVKRAYRRDFLHITAAGYAALNNDLLKLLSK